MTLNTKEGCSYELPSRVYRKNYWINQTSRNKNNSYISPEIQTTGAADLFYHLSGEIVSASTSSHCFSPR